ncbi:MAG TPA: 4-alpha-glucanotransferase [Gaiellaceae bacterium]|nr:4-alpha-glucanotransferase [Gaiellaceae bacterium]
MLHVTSLPGGRLGPEAYRFVDWLAAAGQSWWQVLPLGPPDPHRSPYMASSAFAAWPGLLAKPRARVPAGEAAAFRERESAWIGDWADFAGPGAVEDQVRFAREWSALRAYAAARGVRIIGDLPIYVAPGSADHVAHPELFQRGVVAGAPPDALSAVGQLWGNPLYDWAALRAQGYRWWIERLRRTCQLFDLSRIDHFRGFVSYWSVRAGLATAKAGRWRRGPGEELFAALRRALGPLPIVVEDLGVITPAVHALRDRLGFPGMVVLQFAFGGGRQNPHRPENHRGNLVVYTGTHDTNTALGWWESLSPRRQRATGLDPADPAWSLVRLALGSRAAVSILPAQDVLGLDASARMNMPGTCGPHNWTWRLRPGQLTGELAARLREETQRATRA